MLSGRLGHALGGGLSEGTASDHRCCSLVPALLTRVFCPPLSGAAEA
ncbi:MAG: hypothetical protein QOK04_917 [Solirubrobacteraceae bacterium]|jgi:hypothetical protein|nr:hypothetical protein [Solirubrobacteraceae bacterium]